MRFVAHEPKGIVMKARTKVRVSPTYTRVLALSKQMSGPIKVNLIKGVKTWRKRISQDALFNAWKKKNYSGLERVIPWNTVEPDLDDAISHVGKTVSASSAFSINALPAPMKKELRWDTANPTIDKYMDSRSAEMVKYISESSREVIRSAVRNTYDNAWTPRDVADAIRDNIGLLPQHARAVDRYRASLISDGMDKLKVKDLTSAYADRLLDHRAMMIGRTEARLASNYGQIAVWREAMDQDLMPQTAMKVWIVDGNPCDVCEPMDGVAVPMDDEWELNNGDTVDIPNESHPNCYCGMEVEYDML